MQSSQAESKVCPDLAAGEMFAGVGATHGVPTRRRSALCWGISCFVHLLLLVAVGLLTRHPGEVPQTPPIRVSILPSLETHAQASPAVDANPVLQARMPERRRRDADLSQISLVDPDPLPIVTPRAPLPTLLEADRAVAPVVPEAITPELSKIIPEVGMVREPSPLTEPPKEVLPERVSPDAMPPVVPKMPPPPVVARAPVWRPPQTPPARELPVHGRPAASFDAAVVAPVPPAAESQGDTPTVAAPDARSKEQAPPLASLPPLIGPRYGQNPTPAYPPEARRRGWQGTVLLLVEILEHGRPERISIKHSSGHPILDEAALAAVGRWTFIPAQRDGKPVKSVAEVPIVFSLQNRR